MSNESAFARAIRESAERRAKPEPVRSLVLNKLGFGISSNDERRLMNYNFRSTTAKNLKKSIINGASDPFINRKNLKNKLRRLVNTYHRELDIKNNERKIKLARNAPAAPQPLTRQQIISSLGRLPLSSPPPTQNRYKAQNNRNKYQPSRGNSAMSMAPPPTRGALLLQEATKPEIAKAAAQNTGVPARTLQNNFNKAQLAHLAMQPRIVRRVGPFGRVTYRQEYYDPSRNIRRRMARGVTGGYSKVKRGLFGLRKGFYEGLKSIGESGTSRANKNITNLKTRRNEVKKNRGWTWKR